MGVSNSLETIDRAVFGVVQARHLLSRAGFGGTPAQVQALVDMGLDDAVDRLVDFERIDNSDLPAVQIDPDIIRPPTREERQMMRSARKSDDKQSMADVQMRRQMSRREDRGQLGRLQRWWLSRMIATSRPMQEKLALLWHGHFACNYRTVRDSNLLYRQNEHFRTHAAGSFADLARGIVRDPAMIRFLDNHNNRKQKPNENLARELMELFTLGEGNYSERDIKQGARALTGYTFQDNEFRFAPRMHDDGAKTILGRRGNFDGDDFVDICLEQKACSRFVAYKLYRHFVGDVDYDLLEETPVARGVIHQLSRIVLSNDYEMGPVLKRVLKSRHFYDPAVIGNKIKSPAQLIVGTVRMLDVPLRDLDSLVDAMNLMGQALFNPPSVAGWAGGRSWINTSTLFVRHNACAFLICGKRPGDQTWATDRIEYDPMFLLEDLPQRTPEAIVDHLLSILLGPKVPEERRRQLLTFLAARSGPIKRGTIVGLLLLITAMPEYQLC